MQPSGTASMSFVMEDRETFGPYYDRTLLAWFENVDASWDRLKSSSPEQFYRLWKYYLLSCVYRMWKYFLLSCAGP